MVDDHIVPELFQGLAHSVGHVNRAMTTTRAAQCYAEVRFQFRSILGQEVRYQVHDPIDRFVDLWERAKPVCDRLIVTREGAKLLFKERIGKKPNIEDEARGSRHPLLVGKALDFQRHRRSVAVAAGEGQHLSSQIVR